MTATDSIEQGPQFVVGVGASAGGLEALERLFASMPLDTGLAFVVIQHLSPDHRSLMDELLARFTRLAIVRVAEPTQVRRDTIYLLPPSKEMLIEGDRLVLVERRPELPVHSPITRFLRSLAESWGDRAVAIVLSGTGSDGSQGARAVHDAGGLVLAQSLASARFDGMPRAVISTGCVDRVLAPDEMPACLVHYATSAGTLAPLDDAPASPAERPGIDHVLGRLRDHTGIDFALYKPATIHRRIHRRMEYGHHASVEAYCQAAAGDPAELEELSHDLLIGVTRFFRDEEAFALLRGKIVPELVAAAEDELRVWVPACATGEEAYSLAMLLLSEVEARRPQLNVRLFASDVHRESLRIAGEGVYTPDALAAVPQDLRDEFFVAEPDGRFRIATRVRKRVLFSLHNVLRDVPFNRIDLVSCRNLLIYFGAEGQARALGAFHFALKPRGLLLLGPAEMVGDLESAFEPVDRTWKLYRKLNDVRIPVDLRTRIPTRSVAPGRPGQVTDGRLLRAYDQLLDRFVPAGVLVNERREQQHVFGEGRRFLRPPAGRVTLDVVAMCDGDLRVAVSAALAGAAKRGERVAVPAVRVVGPPPTVVDVVVEPLDDPSGGRYFLVRFVETTAAAAAIAPPFVLQDDLGARIRQLEVELQEARESFSAMLEEFEATNEELQASNEELIAGNEELQSTNEELQSVNEELHSVNAEYNQKIRDLAATGADLRNLISVSHAGVIFTDGQLRLRMFTAGATAVLNLLPQDVGRPLAHITSRIVGDDLMDALAKVQTTRQPTEHTQASPDGRRYQRRILPYQDGDGRPAGFVITFTDVTERLRVEEIERQHHELVKVVIDASQAHIAVLDRNGVIVATNRAWDVFGSDNGGQSGRLLIGTSYLRVALQPELETDDASRAVVDVLTGRRRSVDIDYRCDAPDEPRWFWLNVTPLPEPIGGAVVTHTDITARKRAQALEAKLQESTRLESLGILAGGIAHDFNNLLTGILANVSMMRLDLPDHSPWTEPLGDVQRAAQRAAQLCNQMLAFSGRGRFVLQDVHLPTLVRDTAALIRASLAKATTIELHDGDALPRVTGDASQLQQVIMNLAINASEALPETGGVVRVETRRVQPGRRDDETEVVAASQPTVDHVCVEVSDTGAGIDGGLHRRIFEPFFTTKFTGRGLGLAAVQGIVRGHGGALYLASRPGHGTRFRALFPALATIGPVPEPRDELPAPAVGSAEVLVVDDEEVVRTALTRILKRYGYACVAVGGGVEAIAEVTAAPTRFRLALLDLTMPDPDGVAVFAAVRAIAPDLRVLLMSGYTEAEVDSRFGDAKPDGFMQKPVGAPAVLRAVRAILGQA